MKHRALIIDIDVSLKSDYFRNPNNAYCPYVHNRDRIHPEYAKDEIEQLTVGNITIEDRRGSRQSDVLPILITQSHKGKKHLQIPPPKTTEADEKGKIEKANCLLFSVYRTGGYRAQGNPGPVKGNLGKQIGNHNVRNACPIWNHQLLTNYERINQIYASVSLLKEKDMANREIAVREKIMDRIRRIQRYRKNGDLPSI